MTYTTTLDASHKVRASGGHRTAFARHLGRDADERAGFRFGHSNTGIDRDRTALNRTFVNDGAGGYRAPVVTVDAEGNRRPPSAEMDDYICLLLGDAKRRKDAVALRPFVFKADPAWYDEYNPNWRTEGLNDAALRLHEEATRWLEEWAAEEGYGQANIAYYSDHLDEAGHPERQIAFVPMTADGRLSQKDFFKGRADMRAMHKKLREHLKTTCGYDAHMTVAPRSREHLSSAGYAARADKIKGSIERFAEIEQEQMIDAVANEAEAAELDRRTAAVVEREKAADEDFATIEEVTTALDERAAELDRREQAVGDREAAADTRCNELAARERAADERDARFRRNRARSRLVVNDALRAAEGRPTRTPDERGAFLAEGEGLPAMTVETEITAWGQSIAHRAEQVAAMAESLDGIVERLSEADRATVERGRALMGIEGNAARLTDTEHQRAG